MKKTVAVLIGAILLMMTFTLGACDKNPFDDGGNTNPWEFAWVDDGTNTAGHDGLDENGNPLPKTTLNVVVLADQMERNLMSSFKKAFEEHDKRVTINFTTFPGDYQQAMTTYVAGGQNAMPDVLWTGGEQHIPWSSSG